LKVNGAGWWNGKTRHGTEHAHLPAPATHDWDSVMNRAAFELGKLFPAAHRSEKRAAVEDNVRAANRSLGIGNGDKKRQ